MIISPRFDEGSYIISGTPENPTWFVEYHSRIIGPTKYDFTKTHYRGKIFIGAWTGDRTKIMHRWGHEGIRRPHLLEAVCEKCGETFNPDSESDLVHLNDSLGRECNGFGNIVGWLQ